MAQEIHVIISAFITQTISCSSGASSKSLDIFMVHKNNVMMGAMESQINSLTNVYSTVYSGAYQRKHQSSVSLAFVRGIHTVNSPHKGPVTPKMSPFDGAIML